MPVALVLDPEQGWQGPQNCSRDCHRIAKSSIQFYNERLWHRVGSEPDQRSAFLVGTLHVTPSPRKDTEGFVLMAAVVTEHRARPQSYTPSLQR